MIVFERKKFRTKWPSGVVGIFLAMNLALAMAVLLVLPPPTQAAGMCDGTYPCFTTAACAKAEGDFAACPAKCPGGGAQRGYCYVRQTSIPLTISIAGQSSVLDVGHYVELVYRYAVYIAGIFAAVMFMVGGIQWLTAGGNSGSVSSAKKRIADAGIGLALTLFAWLILNTINPSLVRLQMPRIPMVKQEQYVRCELFKLDRPCGEVFGVKENVSAPPGATEKDRFTIVETTDPDILTTCIGKNCGGVTVDGNSCTVGSCTCQEVATSSTTTTDSGSPSTASSGISWQCRPCSRADQECLGLGPSDECCGGYCGAVNDTTEQITARIAGGTSVETASDMVGSGLPGSCSNGMGGIKCGTGTECHGGLCVDVTDYFQGMTAVSNLAGGIADTFRGVWNLDWTQVVSGLGQSNSAVFTAPANMWAGGICSNGSVGAPCNIDTDCANGNACIEGAGAHYCAPKIIGGFCTNSADCPNGYGCGAGNATLTGDVSSTFTGILSYRCSTSGTATGGRGSNGCTSDADCISDLAPVCSPSDGRSNKICQAVGPGMLCNTGNDNADCNHGNFHGKCVDGAIFGTIFMPTVLNYVESVLSFEFGARDSLGICTEGKDGNGCDGNEDCLSGFCKDFEGVGKLCVGPHSEAGLPCDPEESSLQCGSGLSCDENSQTCVPS